MKQELQLMKKDLVRAFLSSLIDGLSMCMRQPALQAQPALLAGDMASASLTEWYSAKAVVTSCASHDWLLRTVQDVDEDTRRFQPDRVVSVKAVVTPCTSHARHLRTVQDADEDTRRFQADRVVSVKAVVAVCTSRDWLLRTVQDVDEDTRRFQAQSARLMGDMKEAGDAPFRGEVELDSKVSQTPFPLVLPSSGSS